MQLLACKEPLVGMGEAGKKMTTGIKSEASGVVHKASWHQDEALTHACEPPGNRWLNYITR